MKVLYGYVKDKRPAYTRIPHDMKWFGEGEDDIIIQAKGAAFQEIIDRLPSGWLPDMVLFSDPAYYQIPSGIEESPFPTAAIIGDWNLSFEALQKSAGCFDYLFTDLKGVEIFKRHGYGNVEYFPMFSFDPEVHRPLPDIEKVDDICFIGNLNHAVQRERAQWLKRIAMLSQKYKVIIANGIYGEDYTRLLNQSKIIFNRSIRGEMNMRAYEAPACRTLLFFEEENLEVRNFYTDRVHCVLYNESNLEDLLDYYLSNESERGKIAQNGYERVQELTYEKRTAKLLAWIEANIDKLRKENRNILKSSPLDQHIMRSTQASWGITPGSPNAAEAELRKGLEVYPENPELWNNLGVVLSKATEGRLVEAIDYFKQAKEKKSNYILPHLNSAYCYFMTGRLEEAGREVLNAISILEGEVEDITSISGLYLPAIYDTFKVETERISFSCIDPHELYREKKRLFLWKLYEMLGDIYSGKQNPKEARVVYELSIEKRPDFGESRYKLGRVFERIGEFEKALDQYAESLRYNPFIFDCWKSQVNLLNLLGHWKEAGEKCLEYRTMLKASPMYKEHLQYFSVLAVQSLTKQARELITCKCYEEAYAILQELIKIDAENSKLYTMLGECSFFSKKYESAESYLLSALNLNPKNDDVLVSLGVLCYEQGKDKEAYDYFKKAEKINPVNPDLIANYRAIKEIAKCKLL